MCLGLSRCDGPFFGSLNIPRRNCKAGVGGLCAVLQSCPMPGLRGRLIRSRVISLCCRGHSWLAACAALDPPLAERPSCSFPRLLERHRSNLCRRCGANVTGQALQCRPASRNEWSEGPSSRDSGGELRCEREIIVDLG